MGREGAQTGRGLEGRISRSPSGGLESRGGVSRRPAASPVRSLVLQLGLSLLAACGADRGKNPNTGQTRSAALVAAFRSLENFRPLPLPEEITNPDSVFISAASVTPENKIRWIKADISSAVEAEWYSSILEADVVVNSDGTISYTGPVATIDTRTLEQGLHLATVQTSSGNEVCETLIPNVIKDGIPIIDVPAYLGLSDTDGSDIIFGAAHMGRIRGGSIDSGDVVAIPEDSSVFPINDWTEFRSVARIIPSLNPDPEFPEEAFQSGSAIIDDVSRDAYVSGRCRRFLGNCLIPGDDTSDIKFIPYDEGRGDWDLTRMEEIASTNDLGERPIGILNTTVPGTTTEAKCLLVAQGDGLGGGGDYYHCDLTTIPPDPDAGPADTDFNCSGDFTCVAVAVGSVSFERSGECGAACIRPPDPDAGPADTDFNCSGDFTCVAVADGTGSFETSGECGAACIRPPDPDAGPPPDGPQDGPLPDKGKPEEDGPVEIPDETGVQPPRDGGDEREDEGSQTEMPVTDQPPGCGACDVNASQNTNGKGTLGLLALAGAFLRRKKRC